MIGEPKYRKNQNVKFTICGKTIKGKIHIIDKYGTFEQNDEVSYDIFSEEDNCLYKHIPESMVRKGEK